MLLAADEAAAAAPEDDVDVDAGRVDDDALREPSNAGSWRSGGPPPTFGRGSEAVLASSVGRGRRKAGSDAFDPVSGRDLGHGRRRATRKRRKSGAASFRHQRCTGGRSAGSGAQGGRAERGGATRQWGDGSGCGDKKKPPTLAASPPSAAHAAGRGSAAEHSGRGKPRIRSAAAGQTRAAPWQQNGRALGEQRSVKRRAFAAGRRPSFPAKSNPAGCRWLLLSPRPAARRSCSAAAPSSGSSAHGRHGGARRETTVGQAADRAVSRAAAARPRWPAAIQAPRGARRPPPPPQGRTGPVEAWRSRGAARFVPWEPNAVSAHWLRLWARYFSPQITAIQTPTATSPLSTRFTEGRPLPRHL